MEGHLCKAGGLFVLAKKEGRHPEPVEGSRAEAYPHASRTSA
ncbi:hypothetical protein ABIC84_004688 [Mucilaginibacter sp. 3215]